MESSGRSSSGAGTALVLLLTINLFNYIDRQVLAAVEPEIRATFFAPGDVNAMTKTGFLATAFLVTYMLSAPVLGFLADRMSRWVIVGSAVILWSLASGASGLALTFGMLFATRICVGIGEGGYGPAAPTILADLYPIETRGRIMAIFYAAIPVGSALGLGIGGAIGSHLGWRWAFYSVAPPGFLLGLLCFWQRDSRVASHPVVQKSQRRSLRDYLKLFQTRSYLINCIAQTLMTFAVGGLRFGCRRICVSEIKAPPQDCIFSAGSRWSPAWSRRLSAASSRTSCGRDFLARTFWFLELAWSSRVRFSWPVSTFRFR